MNAELSKLRWACRRGMLELIRCWLPFLSTITLIFLHRCNKISNDCSSVQIWSCFVVC